MPGGTFTQGENDPLDKFNQHTTTVSGFALDTFEVTVGRFRKFVEAYPGSRPTAGAGAHPLIANTGWRPEWDDHLPQDGAAYSARLRCGLPDEPKPGYWDTWTAAPGAHETLPITCVNWFDMFAFCAWDGGRLPTEAEWELAASGGEEREYPWGSELPDATRAVFSGQQEFLAAAVGGRPAGMARWGHHDMTGNVWEYVLDGLSDYSKEPCNDCANTQFGFNNVARGGGYNTPYCMKTWEHCGSYVSPELHMGGGARCARDIPK